MKKNTPLSRALHLFLVLLICNQSYGQTGPTYVGFSDANFSDAHHNIIVKITHNSKIQRIRLYPENGLLFFTAEGEAGKSYQLLVFDIDSKLIRQVNVCNGESTILKVFKNGSYLFQVYGDDACIGNGSMLVN